MQLIKRAYFMHHHHHKICSPVRTRLRTNHDQCCLVPSIVYNIYTHLGEHNLLLSPLLQLWLIMSA